MQRMSSNELTVEISAGMTGSHLALLYQFIVSALLVRL